MPKSWGDSRERQYVHIRDPYMGEGVSNDEAEQRAVSTINKQRAEHGETRSAKNP